MAAFRDNGITYVAGYGTAGPVLVPLKFGPRGAGQRHNAPEGYNGYAGGAYSGPVVFGAGPSSAATAAVDSGNWKTGVIVGLSVWALTKLLDRMFFGK